MKLQLFNLFKVRTLICVTTAFVIILSCKKVAKDNILPNPDIHLFISGKQAMTHEPLDSAELINYVASFSNLLNKQSFKDYYSLVKDEVDPFNPENRLIDPLLSNGILNLIRNDKVFQKELDLFSQITNRLNDKYNIKSYTKMDWEKLLRSTHKAGIFLFPDAKKKIIDKLESRKRVSSARIYDTPCADAYEQQELLISGLMVGFATSCGFGGISPTAIICWAAAVGTYAFLQYDLENNFWCRCMMEHYGACLY
ncbi:hypothetical protein HRH25_05840 [Flavisolibacter sp. BT320]|nr:hypothetical protein [Flavisolibacter longurius]